MYLRDSSSKLRQQTERCELENLPRYARVINKKSGREMLILILVCIDASK